MQEASNSDTRIVDEIRTTPRGLEFVHALEANGLPHLAAAVAQRLQVHPISLPSPGPGSAER